MAGLGRHFLEPGQNEAMGEGAGTATCGRHGQVLALPLEAQGLVLPRGPEQPIGWSWLCQRLPLPTARHGSAPGPFMSSPPWLLREL